MSATINFRRFNFLGSTLAVLFKNAVGNREPAVKTNISQNRCRVFRKSPWWDLSCDDDIWLREQATMNRAQNSFVDEQLEQVQSTHDELRCISQITRQCKHDQQRHTTCLIKAESVFWISVTHQIVSLRQSVNT